MNGKVYQLISSSFVAMQNCEAKGNSEGRFRHHENMVALVKRCLPNGSGFDAGTTLIEKKSRADRLVFGTAYHHRNEGGYYDGWTQHEVVVTPSLLSEINVRVMGRNRSDIKDYIAEVFCHALVEQPTPSTLSEVEK